MNDILQSAIQMKQAETDSRRPKFRSAPQYYQATLFHADHVTALRSLPVGAKIVAGQRMHDVARLLLDKANHVATTDNSAERRDLLHRAQQEYEAAYGLFVFMTPLSNEWRKNGVRDEYVAYEDTIGGRSEPKRPHPPSQIVEANEVEAQAAAVPQGELDGIDFVVKTLCHLSICLSHNDTLRDVRLEALREANRRDQWNLRAAYLLAKELQRRSESSSSELQQAIEVLGVALAHAQTSSQSTVLSEHVAHAAELLRRLEGEHQSVSAQQKLLMKRFLERSAHEPLESRTEADQPTPVEKHCDTPRKAAASKVTFAEEGGSDEPKLQGDWYQQAEQARAAIRRLHQEGKPQAAASLQRQLDEAAAEKFFVEFMVPRKMFDINAISTVAEAEAFCSQLHLSPTTDQHIADYLSDKIHSYATQYLPLQQMTILEVELMLFSLGIVSSTELNDLDARHRHNAYFVSKTEHRGLVSTTPLLGGMDPMEVETRGRQLRALLMQHLTRTTPLPAGANVKL